MATNMVARAKEKGFQAESHSEKAWYSEDQESEHWLRFWYLGYRNRQVITSLCCEIAEKSNRQVREILDAVLQMLATLRFRAEKSPLLRQELQSLDEQRAVIAEVLRAKYDAYALPRIKSDLPILQRIVDDRIFSPEQEYQWSCVGVVFGDVVANELELDWIAQCDEYGVEPALNLHDTSITLFPRSMILKRIEKGETPDLHHLIEALDETIQDFKQKGC